MRGVALLLAAGSGTRLGAGPKAFVEVGGVPLVRRSAAAAAGASLVDRIVAAVPAGSVERARTVLAGLPCRVDVIAGGATRQGSAAIALASAPDAEAVVVHDAARALCPPSLFDACLAALDEAEAAVAAVPIRDTVKRVADGHIHETLDRTRLWGAQTPQAFRADVYRKAHEVADQDGVEATDDAALLERLGVAVKVIDGPEWNIKVTTRWDLSLAEVVLRAGGPEALLEAARA